MKITTDVNSAGLRQAGNVLPRSSTVNRSMNVSDAKIAQDVMVKMQREKSLVDALAIAQSSRELVQKALNISSRLMSLAAEGMITGRVNMDEVSSQMSSINGAMGSYGERVSVSVPVNGTSAPVDDVQVKLDESFARIKNRADEMLSGKPVEKKDFEPVAADLKVIASEIDLKINKYSAELGSVKKIEGNNFNFPGLTKNTADLVVNNSARALEAQGNINYEMAGKLTKA